MMDIYIAEFYTSLYMTEIQKLSFQLPHVIILGTNHSGNTICEVFNFCRAYQDVLYCHDYDERLVAIFAHQIQYE